MTETVATPQSRLATFRQRREESVVAPQGNLALVNTQWVDSEQTIYGVAGVWSPLPTGESGLKVVAAASDNIVVDGVLVDGEAIVRGKNDPHAARTAHISGVFRCSGGGARGLRCARRGASAESGREPGAVHTATIVGVVRAAADGVDSASVLVAQRVEFTRQDGGKRHPTLAL